MCVSEDVLYQEHYLDMQEAVDLTEGELLDLQQSTEEISDGESEFQLFTSIRFMLAIVMHLKFSYLTVDFWFVF